MSNSKTKKIGEEHRKESKQENFEILEIPEVVIQNERGAHLVSLLLKAYDPKWGNNDHPLTAETTAYFRRNPLNERIVQFLESIKALEDDGVDEETLYILSLTYEHPERSAQAFSILARYKPHIGNPQSLRQKLFDVLQILEQSPELTPLEIKFADEAEKDMAERQEGLLTTRQQISELINFFKPNPTTTGIRKITLMPTDPLYKKDSGAGFSFGEELVIKNHIENPDNIDHEFLHCIINLIVEKLLKVLTEEQGAKILRMANERLITDQEYGEDVFSLLCEELIRTYNDYVKKKEKPLTYEDLLERIFDISDEEEFQDILLGEDVNFKRRCDELGIATLQDLKDKSQEYFNRFVNNLLQDLVFEFYQEYINRPDKEGKNFEQFVLARFPDKIRF